MKQYFKYWCSGAFLTCSLLHSQMPPGNNPSLNAVQNNLQMQHMMNVSRSQAEAARRMKAQRQKVASDATKSAGVDTIRQLTSEAWRIKWIDDYSFPILDGDEVLTVKKTTETPYGSHHSLTTENVICFGLKDGKKLWDHLVVGELESSPQYFEGLVIYSTKDFELVALNRNTGKEQYRVHLDKLKRFFMGNRPPYVQYPLLEGNHLYVATYGKSASGDPSGKLYALDLINGKLIWDQTIELGGSQPPILLDDLILVGGEKMIHAIRVADGKLAWKFNTFGPTISQSGVAVAGNWCFTASNMLYALDAKTGEKKWSSKIGDKLYVLGEGDRLVYTENVGMFGSGERVIGLDAKTGMKAWETKLDGGPPWTAWWIQDGVVLLAKEGEIEGINMLDGKVLWRYTVPGKVRSFPSFFGTQMILAGTESGKSTIHALNFGDGKRLWTYMVPEKPGDDPLVVDQGGILFMTKSRNLIALK